MTTFATAGLTCVDLSAKPPIYNLPKGHSTEAYLNI
jgi:hypothetical protein